MTRILMQAGKHPLTPLTHEQSLAISSVGVFGSNSGNALFYSGVSRALSTPDTTIVPDGYLYRRREPTPEHAAKINDSYDRFVMPMANAYKMRFLDQLERLTKLVTNLTIPVSVIGVGAQMPYGRSFNDINGDYKRTVRRFTAAVLDRSPSVGVRGEYTADLLVHLGFDESQIRVIGCPSLFTFGAAKEPVRKVEHLVEDSKIAFNATPSVHGVTEFLEANAEKYDRSVVIAQESERLALMLWGENSSKKEDPRLPVHRDHPLYLQDRMRMFVDPHVWFNYLGGYDFCVGTRIHGNIAGMLGGTPSLVLAHDSRTTELAQFTGIPYRMFHEVKDMDVAELYAEADYSQFEKRQAENLETYKSFLDSHGLDHVFTPGNENPEYDEKLASESFPGPVHTLAASGDMGRRQIVERMAWLRQGYKGDFARPAYAYKPPVGGPKLIDQDKMRQSVRELQSEVKELRALSAQQAADGRAPRSPKESLSSQVKTIAEKTRRRVKRELRRRARRRERQQKQSAA